jgi:hypothetical protein
MMSLEDAIYRLAGAVQAQGEASAVKELIRQRDDALELSRRDKRNWEWADGKRSEYARLLDTERRRVRSLRAVIRRIKKEGQ